MRIEQGASPPNIRSGSITTKHQVRRAGRRGHHHQISGQKMRIEKGASPPNFRCEDQEREGSITTKSGCKIRIEKGASSPNIR